MKIATNLYFLLALCVSGNIAFAQNAKRVDSPSGTVRGHLGNTNREGMYVDASSNTVSGKSKRTLNPISANSHYIIFIS